MRHIFIIWYVCVQAINSDHFVVNFRFSFDQTEDGEFGIGGFDVLDCGADSRQELLLVASKLSLTEFVVLDKVE